MRFVRGLSDSPVPRSAISTSTFKTGDTTLDGLLEAAQSKFLSDRPDLRREALEKLWDAWERLKTLEPAKDKKDSTRILLDRVTTEPNLRGTIENEAKELTLIGNSYMIRHTEIGKAQISSLDHVDYLFHRMFSLVRLILRSTGRGG
ncbi:MAG: hypothetical protein ACRD3P_12520 [Terriglobales bacterium]